MSETKTGYGNPPLRHQFKPGKSGNPRGRPKGSRNLSTDLAAVLSGTVEISDEGKQRRVSRQEAMLLKLCSQALGGDIRAAATVMDLGQRLLKSSDMRPQDLSETDQQIIDDFLRRHAARQRRDNDI
jgi:hypothetical protein